MGQHNAAAYDEGHFSTKGRVGYYKGHDLLIIASDITELQLDVDKTQDVQ